MEEKRQQLIKISICVLCIVSALYAGKEAVRKTGSGNVKTAKASRVVVIDAGHGSGNLRKVAKGK